MYHYKKKRKNIISNTEKCKKTGKTKYKSHEQASRGMMYIFSHDPHIRADDLHTYTCPSCGEIHIGHNRRW